MRAVAARAVHVSGPCESGLCKWSMRERSMLVVHASNPCESGRCKSGLHVSGPCEQSM